MSKYVLYSNIETHDTIFELWGGSTKHPDLRFRFSDFNKCSWVDEWRQIFQWLLECASKLSLPSHAYDLAEWAMKYAKPF